MLSDSHRDGLPQDFPDAIVDFVVSIFHGERCRRRKDLVNNDATVSWCATHLFRT